MSFKSRAAVVLTLCALAAAAVVLWYRARAVTPAALLKRLPAQNAVLLSVDFDQLRRAGILQMLDGSKVGEDAEYQGFVRKTNFNYKQDLESALVAFAPTGKFLLLKGRFDWKSLRAYVAEQGGTCDSTLCRMQGSAPDRRISFFALQSGVMALAVSPDDSAVLRLKVSAAEPVAVPEGAVWLSIPVSTLQSGENLPAGTRAFARTLRQAEDMSIAFVPEGRRLAARMNVTCRNEPDAADAALELTRVTGLLRQMIEREHQTPNPGDLSGVLTAGSFRPEGRLVRGYWPIERSFVENMLGASGAGGSPAPR